MHKVDNSIELEVAKIKVSPYFFRENPAAEDLEILAQSIATLGQIHPVSVVRLTKKSPKGAEYELINGHRRLLAVRKAGLEKIRADVYEYTPDEASEAERTIAVTQFLHAANYQEPLTPLERAKNYKELMENLDFDVEGISKLMNRPEADIREDLKYAWISPEVQHIVTQPENAGKITREHLRVLATWASPDKKGWRLAPEGQKVLVDKLLSQEDKETVDVPAKFDKAIKSYVQEERRKKVDESKKQEQAKKAEQARTAPEKVTSEIFTNLTTVEKAIQKLTQTELPKELQLTFIDKSELMTRLHTLARELAKYAEYVSQAEERPEPAMAAPGGQHHGR